MTPDECRYEAKELQALHADATDKFDKVFDRHRQALEHAFTTRHQKLLAVTALFKETLLAMQNRGWNTHAKLWNIGLYVNIATHDLSVLVWQLGSERDIWARKLAARHLALALYEISEDLPQLLGKPMREGLSTLGVLEEYSPMLRSVQQPLNTFKRMHPKVLQDTRRIAAAHRDHDGLLLLREIEQIDVESISTLGMELDKIMRAIGQQLQEILGATSTVAPPEVHQL